MRYRTNEWTLRRRASDSLGDASTPSTSFMLNCYDVWSATPKSASAFDCAAGSDAPTD